MIVSFYDKDFNALFNNSSLVVDKDTYNLVKRPIELNDFSCECEPITEDVIPTFIVVKNDNGNNKELIYSALAGVPILNENNKTEINATDLKILFSSDIVLTYGSYNYVWDVIRYIFTEWNNQVNDDSISCRLICQEDAQQIALTNLVPTNETQVYNALDEISAYLNAYNLYIDSKVDLQEKEVVFTIGKMMTDTDVANIKLWERGIRNYGKWVTDVNETQGYDSDFNAGIKWILTQNNDITINESERDIYPIKKRIVVNNDIDEANKEALIELLNSRYNEDIELPTNNEHYTFKTRFDIYVRRGEDVFKSLPCGELRYNSSGLYEIQIGFRYTGINFI